MVFSMKGLCTYIEFDSVLSNCYSYRRANESTPSWTGSYCSERCYIADYNAI